LEQDGKTEMNREILFRGIKIGSANLWIKGSLRIHRSLPESDEYCIEPLCCPGATHNFIKLTTKWIEVYKQTVGQFTGFKDKDGNKVFEHDIIRFDGTNHFCIINFNDGFVGAIHTNGATFPLSIFKDYSIIGNVFENPELVKRFPKKIRGQYQ